MTKSKYLNFKEDINIKTVNKICYSTLYPENIDTAIFLGD